MTAAKDQGGIDVVSAVRRHATATPHRVALTWLTGFTDPLDITYGELDDTAAAVAAALRARVGVGDRVLVVRPPGLDFVTVFLGCLYAECVPIPVYPLLDNDDNVATVRRVLADSGAAVAWAGDETIADVVGRTLDVSTLWAVSADRHRPDGTLAANRLAFLQYTSGSTGHPRGVMVGHGNLTANLAAIRTAFRHDADSVVLSWLPAYHDMGLIGNILHPLHTGCHAYLASPLDFLRQPLRWPTAIARYHVTTSGAPNFAYDLVVRAAADGSPELDLSTWRTAYCGAEPVSHLTLRRFADLLAPHGFRREAFVPCHGLAEATLLVTSADVGEGLTVRPGPVVSCGTPRDCRVAR